MQSKSQIIQMIRRHRRFIISSHINPEGDSLGSALALRGLLVKLGKKVQVIWEGPVPKAYRFLPGSRFVQKKPTHSYDACFVVDCPVLGRIGSMQQYFLKGKPVGVIDHHISNERFGTVNWVAPQAAAVGEMILELFKALRVKIEIPDAMNLYVSMVTDTGSFRYSNTTSKVHTYAAELIRLGVNPSNVANELYESHSLSSRRLLQAALKTLNVSSQGRIAWIKVTRNMMKRYRTTPEETEGIVDFARSIQGVQIAVFFREEKNGTVKVSLRSKKGLNVNRIAAVFGGGGHRAASGCLIQASLKQAEQRVLQEVRKALR